MIVRKDALFLVVEIEGEHVGSGYGLLKNAVPYKTPKKYTYLGFMNVILSSRGKRIIRDIERPIKWSHKKNIYEIPLAVYAENEWAIKAFELDQKLFLLHEKKPNRSYISCSLKLCQSKFL